MTPLEFTVLALAVWRISSLIINDAGPFEIFAKFRHLVGVRYNEHSEAYGTNELAELFVCICCFSIWVGTAWAILYWYAPVVAFWLALPLSFSAVAIVVNRYANP